MSASRLVSAATIVWALFLLGCAERGPDVIVTMNDAGFPLVFVPICDGLEATMEFPTAGEGALWREGGLMFREEITCPQGPAFSIEAYVTRWTGVFADGEFDVVVNGRHFNVGGSATEPEITGERVAFLLSGDVPRLPYVALPMKGQYESNVEFRYTEYGRREVATWNVDSASGRYSVEYYDYVYAQPVTNIERYSARLKVERAASGSAD